MRKNRSKEGTQGETGPYMSELQRANGAAKLQSATDGDGRSQSESVQHRSPEGQPDEATHGQAAPDGGSIKDAQARPEPRVTSHR